jgi:RND family efflux transporter MFP subunit
VIATLDREDFRLQVEAARASYRQARAAAQNARSELRRAKALYADDNISISDYERAHTTYETKQNQSEAALRRLDLAKKRLAYTRLTAPTPGSIAGTRVEAGENVRAGQPVARLTSGDRLEVTVEVPEGMVERIQTGQQAAVTATTMGDSTVMGAVTEIAAAPSGSRPTYPVVVTLRKPVPSLRSGMSAQVRFTSDHRSGLVVPSSAVSEDHRGRFVYIVDCPGATADTTLASGADGRIRRQAVSTGDIIDRGLVIRDSLGAGDEVVIAGHSMIAPGDPVRISQLLTDR